MNDAPAVRRSKIRSHNYMAPYYSDVARSAAVLTRDEERELATRARAGDDEARAEMIRHNLRLVISIARRFQGRGMDLEDLIQHGNLGLMKAFERFDPERGVKFSTYATWWVRQAIGRALEFEVQTIHVPKNRHERIEVQAIPDEYPLAARGAAAPLEQAERGDERARLMAALAKLSRRGAEVLRRRWGLDGARKETLLEVGASWGVTRERVRQIERHALACLKAVLLGKHMPSPRDMEGCCMRGHKLSGANVRYRGNGRRYCVKCDRDQRKRLRSRRARVAVESRGRIKP